MFRPPPAPDLLEPAAELHEALTPSSRARALRVLGAVLPFVLSLLPWLGSGLLPRSWHPERGESGLRSSPLLELRSSPTPAVQAPIPALDLPPRRVRIVALEPAEQPGRVRGQASARAQDPLFENRKLEGG